MARQINVNNSTVAAGSVSDRSRSTYLRTGRTIDTGSDNVEERSHGVWKESGIVVKGRL